MLQAALAHTGELVDALGVCIGVNNHRVAEAALACASYLTTILGADAQAPAYVDLLLPTGALLVGVRRCVWIRQHQCSSAPLLMVRLMCDSLPPTHRRTR